MKMTALLLQQVAQKSAQYRRAQTAGKQTMQSTSSSDAADGDVALNRRSFHAQLSRSFFQSRSSSSSSVDGGSSSPSKSRLGTVPVEDPITHENVVNSKVLLLYTGGALGWKVDPNLEGKHFKVRNYKMI